ncbi:MAG: cation:proton antiporter [Candidatus Omnitrophota bacterium]
MLEQIQNILNNIHLPHLHILLLLGLALFSGAIGGRVFQKLRVPQVVGYITIGIIIGESGFKIVDHDIIKSLEPFSYFALGLIGFTIGGELKKDILVKYGKQFISILLSEGIGAFLAVSVLVGITGTFLFGSWRIAWSLGLLLGAIASATAPAATSEVIREYKTRGPLTRTVLGIVALDDGLALILFAIATSIAGNLSGDIHQSTLRVFIHPIYEIGVSIGIGILFGSVLNRLLRKYAEKERILAFCIGTVLLASGVAITINVDMLLAIMTLGVVVTNSVTQKAKEAFKLLEGFTPPIYVLFFVLVGAKLNISYMSLSVILLAVIYLIGRSGGKMLGAFLGAKASNATKTVQKYLPLCLFSQAGVAIGLSILASNYFPGEISNAIVVIITFTVFILELIGPYFVKIAVTRAGEVGINITEEDFINKTQTKEIMEKSLPLIYENDSLDKVLSTFTETPNLYYPVVDKDKKLTGIIGVDSIKNTLAEKELIGLALAADLQEPVVAKINENSMLSEAKNVLNKYNIEYLPVVTEADKVVGFIERRILAKAVSAKMMELQKQVESA